MKRPALLAAGASALLLVTSLPVLSAADEPAPFVRTAAAGALELAIDGDAVTVTYLTQDGEEDLAPDPASAALTLRRGDRCQVDTGALDGLLSIGVESPTSSTVGLVNNGLGTWDRNNCNTENGRLEDGEGLVLSLGDLFGADVAIGGGLLDIEGKFGADLELTGTYAGMTVLDTVADLTGDASDNGADSGSSDNTAVALDIDGAVDTLRLTPTSDDGRGTVSLEGGGDYDTPDENRTVLELVRYESFEYAFGCGDTVTEDQGQLGLGDVTSATLTRYDDETDCRPIGVDLSEDDGLLLRKTTTDVDGGDQDPALRLQLTWRVELDGRTVEEVRAELGREIDLLDGSPVSNVEYCSTNNDAGDVLGDDYDPMDLTTAARSDKPNGVPWCLLTETQTVVDGYLVQVQVYDGAGDPRFF